MAQSYVPLFTQTRRERAGNPGDPENTQADGKSVLSEFVLARPLIRDG